MNLLIDVGAIKTGGGAQLALNFLDLIAKDYDVTHKKVVLVPDAGPLSKFCFDKEKFDIYVYPSNYLARFWFERRQLKKIVERHHITHFYTFFGAGLPSNKSIKSVVTTAYPIICYPESPFWQYVSRKVYWKNRINNHLRRARLRNADVIIVETDVMKTRIARHVPFPEKNIIVLPPVPSRYLQASAGNLHRDSTNGIGSTSPVNFVLVSGCDSHKNVWRLPEIAQALEQTQLNNFVFTLTVDETRFVAHTRLDQTAFKQVRHRFRFLGSVDPRNIQQVYDEADFLLNLSDLESFSNNYMEAWKAGIPIIASDRDFARGICDKSAWYVEPHQPQACAAAIAALVQDRQKQREMVRQGKEKLNALGNEHERYAKVMAILADGSPSPVQPVLNCAYSGS